MCLTGVRRFSIRMGANVCSGRMLGHLNKRFFVHRCRGLLPVVLRGEDSGVMPKGRCSRFRGAIGSLGGLEGCGGLLWFEEEGFTSWGRHFLSILFQFRLRHEFRHTGRSFAWLSTLVYFKFVVGYFWVPSAMGVLRGGRGECKQCDNFGFED